VRQVCRSKFPNPRNAATTGSRYGSGRPIIPRLESSRSLRVKSNRDPRICREELQLAGGHYPRKPSLSLALSHHRHSMIACRDGRGKGELSAGEHARLRRIFIYNVEKFQGPLSPSPRNVDIYSSRPIVRTDGQTDSPVRFASFCGAEERCG